MKDLVKENILKKLDHGNLNDFFRQPSTENIIYWIWDELENKLKGLNYCLYEIKLWEMLTSFFVYKGGK